MRERIMGPVQLAVAKWAFQHGASLTDCAKQLGCAISTIHGYARREGWRKPQDVLAESATLPIEERIFV